MGDTGIMIGIFASLLLMAFTIPIITNEYGQSSNGINVVGLEENLGQGAISELSFGSFITSFFQVFFWSFGAFPLIFDLFLLLLKSIFGLLIYRNIRGVGG